MSSHWIQTPPPPYVGGTAGEPTGRHGLMSLHWIQVPTAIPPQQTGWGAQWESCKHASLLGPGSRSWPDLEEQSGNPITFSSKVAGEWKGGGLNTPKPPSLPQLPLLAEQGRCHGWLLHTLSWPLVGRSASLNVSGCATASASLPAVAAGVSLGRLSPRLWRLPSSHFRTQGSSPYASGEGVLPRVWGGM